MRLPKTNAGSMFESGPGPLDVCLRTGACPGEQRYTLSLLSDASPSFDHLMAAITDAISL